MPTSRRTPRDAGRPRSRTGPGRGSAGRSTRPAAAAAAAREPRRPRFTGRAAILVLVLAVLTVSYASSLRAYLHQRSHIEYVKGQIAERAENIDDLEREKRRWHDPAYVQAQARERFGYLMPGETSYVVLGEDGKPLSRGTNLPDASEVGARTPTAWWSTAWDSVELAGNPPRDTTPPATDIKPPAEEIGQ